ncbi:hypothetical protein D9M68_808290 [compost metagenome]
MARQSPQCSGQHHGHKRSGILPQQGRQILLRQTQRALQVLRKATNASIRFQNSAKLPLKSLPPWLARRNAAQIAPNTAGHILQTLCQKINGGVDTLHTGDIAVAQRQGPNR